jgi:hypothetical protein
MFIKLVSYALITCTIISPFFAGCAGRSGGKISNSKFSIDNLKLNWTLGDLTTYRLITDAQRQAYWDGTESAKPSNFIGGLTRTRTEITFEQLVKQIYSSGNAQLQIKITGLKYLSVVRDIVSLDFDSTKPNSPSNLLSKLTGLSYSIEITPIGEIVRIVDADNALTEFIAANATNQTIIKLLSTDAIKERHTIRPLVTAQNRQLNIGQSWTTAETVSFDLMGNKTYEKTYTLDDITDEPSGERTAVISMLAAPVPQQTTAPFIFNTNEVFTGVFKLELNKSIVRQNREELAVEWEIREKTDQPAAMRVSATRLYDCEIIK